MVCLLLQVVENNKKLARIQGGEREEGAEKRKSKIVILTMFRCVLTLSPSKQIHDHDEVLSKPAHLRPTGPPVKEAPTKIQGTTFKITQRHDMYEI